MDESVLLMKMRNNKWLHTVLTEFHNIMNIRIRKHSVVVHMHIVSYQTLSHSVYVPQHENYAAIAISTKLHGRCLLYTWIE